MAKEVKKIGLLTRERIVEGLKQGIKDTESYFFISFNKLGAFPLNQLRNNLRDSGARILVAKNSLFERALKDLGWEDIGSLLKAETGIVVIKDHDLVKACKILVDFAKESEVMQLKGGVIKERRISPKEINTLAKLPSREVLISQVVSSFAAPLSGFLNTLNQVILKFVWVVEEIKKVKERKKD
ncbi:MAG: 50S ribosomal protein L10 [Candidatus Omnitrophota bacterium]